MSERLNKMNQTNAHTLVDRLRYLFLLRTKLHSIKRRVYCYPCNSASNMIWSKNISGQFNFDRARGKFKKTE